MSHPPYDYRVEIDKPDPNVSCYCDDCTWVGPFSELKEIDDCNLTPGHPSPAGRCPECNTLAYIAQPQLEPSTMALKKALLMIEEQGYRIDGLLLRKENMLAIITDLGRVESFDANEHGGIQQPEPEPATIDEIHRARDLYAKGSDDDIEINDNARVSRGEDGCFVEAWVWLRDEEKNSHCEMHEWTHHEAIRKTYKRKRFEIVANELVGNISYYLVYQASWPQGLRFHYMSANPDFARAHENLDAVNEPFKPWFINAMNRYKAKN